LFVAFCAPALYFGTAGAGFEIQTLPWSLPALLSEQNNTNTHASYVFCLALIKGNVN
jgi:hypothetical protein